MINEKTEWSTVFGEPKSDNQLYRDIFHISGFGKGEFSVKLSLCLTKPQSEACKLRLGLSVSAQ
jgi:hypothetical protein